MDESLIMPFGALVVVYLFWLIIKWTFWPEDHEQPSKNAVTKFLNQPLPSHQYATYSWPALIVVVLGSAAAIWKDHMRDHSALSFYLLGFSLMVFIAGVASFSHRERERTRKAIMAAEPDRAAVFNAADWEEKAKARGRALLLIGVGLFVVWCWLYGFSSLAIGV
jgi:hypothetical protein